MHAGLHLLERITNTITSSLHLKIIKSQSHLNKYELIIFSVQKVRHES